MSKKFAAVWYSLGTVLVIIPILSLISMFRNYVLFFPWGFAICCFLLPAVSRAVKRKSERAYKVWKGIFLSLFFAFIAYFGVVSGFMIDGMKAKMPNEACDIIVLGSGIKGDQPDIMMRERLLKTAEYLKEHPESRAICCGGKSPYKAYSEAEIMKKFLIEQGIEEDRIFLDEESTSTRENVMFARELIDSLGESEKPLAICTSDFHLYRSVAFAEREGLGRVYGLPAKTPAHIFPAFWIREFFGISRMWILGY